MGGLSCIEAGQVILIVVLVVGVVLVIVVLG